MSSDFASLTRSEIIALHPKSGRFLVHKDVLELHSLPFKKALSGDWIESTNRKLELCDWDEHIVGLAVEFMYTGQYNIVAKKLVIPDIIQPINSSSSSLVLDCTQPPPESCAGKEEVMTQEGRLRRCADSLLSHARVYALAQYKDIHDLRCLAIEHLGVALKALSPIPPGVPISSIVAECASYIYGNTESLKSCEEPARALFTSFIVRNLSELHKNQDFLNIIADGGDLARDVVEQIGMTLPTSEMTVVQYVSNIRVVHSTDVHHAPPDHLSDRDSGRDNLCWGIRDKYTWLVPEYTYNEADACTSFHILTHSSNCGAEQNIGFGRGVTRRLGNIKATDTRQKIIMVALLCSDSEIESCEETEYGSFDGMTADINNPLWTEIGRYVYIAWKCTASTKSQ